MSTLPPPEPTGPGEESVWDYPRPPLLERSPALIEVVLGGFVIASTTASWRGPRDEPPAELLPPARRVPVGAVLPAPGTSLCEWKGEATYWTLRGGDRVAESAAWSYENPTTGFAPIAGHLAVYAGRVDECRVDGEVVVPQAGRLLRRLDHARGEGPVQGRRRHAGLVTGAPVGRWALRTSVGRRRRSRGSWPHDLEALEEHRERLAPRDPEQLATTGEEVAVDGSPVLERAVALTLVVRELRVGGAERTDAGLGGLHDAARPAVAAQDDPEIARFGRRHGVAVLGQQACRCPLHAPQHEVDQLVRHLARVAERVDLALTLERGTGGAQQYAAHISSALDARVFPGESPDVVAPAMPATLPKARPRRPERP